jgi:AAA family ATP:ADP antiporter
VSAEPREREVRPGEMREALLAGALFFLLLSSYFILRPIRDALGVAAGVSKLPYLFLGTLAVMLVANPVFSAVVARFPVKRFIPYTYQFFVVSLAAFHVAERVSPSVWVGRAFFVWTSVFNLFIPSIFWAFMVDRFDAQQGKRLFGLIGVGGTLGSIVGSATAAALARVLGPHNLLLVSAALLEAGTLLVFFYHASPAGNAAASAREALPPVGGSAWQGLRLVMSSRYLLGVAAFLLLYTVGSTVLYFEQADVVGKAFTDPAQRTELLARMELAVQSTTAVVQGLFTARILRKAGVGLTLALMPAVSVVGFVWVGSSGSAALPSLGVVIAFSVLRRSSNFALTNPAMEVLFTVVDRPTKYKAKSFLETFVYRAGDQIAAWSYGGLTLLGLSLTSIAWLAVPLSLAFLGLAFWLGRRQAALQASAAS